MAFENCQATRLNINVSSFLQTLHFAMIIRKLYQYSAGRLLWAISPRNYSSSANDVLKSLSEPSWSIKSLQDLPSGNEAAKITSSQLHHLLRLSALPQPKSAEQEANMIATLESQLHFVQAIQKVDTSGVKPLQSIRDETEAAEEEIEFDLESMRTELDKEEVIGVSGRILRKNEVQARSADHVDPIALAPLTVGRFVVVERGKQSSS